MKKIYTLLILAVFTGQIVNAQIELSPTVIASAGSYAEAGNISLSWTLGEIAVSSLSNDNLILTQGFQQGYLNNTAVDWDELDWNISAYPNPVKKELSIAFDLLTPGDYFIEIQDVTGRVMSETQHDNIHSGDIVKFKLDGYKYGIYFFRISTPDKEQMRVISVMKQ